MANTDVYLNLVGGKAVLQDSGNRGIGPITLEYEDTLTIKLGSGFSGTTSLSKVEIFKWENGAKGNSVGSWPASTSIGVLGVSLSGSDVVVTDDDDGAADGDYGYSVTATSVVNGNSTDYTADPELLAKKKRGGNVRADAARKPRAPEADA